MPIMEFFGFACGVSPTGPNFPLLPESVLKDYPVELMGHPAVPSVQLFPYDFMHMDLTSLYQECVDYYFEALQSPLARNISAGIIAAAVIYCSWKVNVCWNSDINMSPSCEDTPALKVHDQKVMNGPKNSSPEDSGENASKDSQRDSSAAVICASQTKIVDIDQLAGISDKFQRQLIDALCKLDDLRFRLKDLESEKELLTAEIDLRKKIAHKLQAENSSERDKRQQAELKMEMMEIENSQLRHLRKELTVKTGQVEKLEKFIKQKENIQTKLFEDNVIFPRAIAETRAKEFRTLQSRIQHLEAEVDVSNRRLVSGVGYQLIKSPSLFYFNEGPIPPSSPVICDPLGQMKNVLTETTGMSPESSNNGRCPGTRMKLPEKEPTINLSHTKFPVVKISRSKTSPSLIMSKKTPSEKTHSAEEVRCGNIVKLGTQCDEPSTSSDKPGNMATHCDSTNNKSHGVFAQIRALISGFRESSSESESVNQLEMSSTTNQGTPNLSTDVYTNSERVQDYPLSDEQSSIFMSASGGSDTSNTDQRREPTKSNSKSSSKKALHIKRMCRYKRDRCRNKDKVSKRRHPGRVSSGQSHLLGPGNTREPPSDSSDWSHKTAVKNVPITAARKNNSQICGKFSGESQDALDSTLNSSDEDDEADSGDSWIVIVPSAS